MKYPDMNQLIVSGVTRLRRVMEKSAYRLKKIEDRYADKQEAKSSPSSVPTERPNKYDRYSDDLRGRIQLKRSFNYKPERQPEHLQPRVSSKKPEQPIAMLSEEALYDVAAQTIRETPSKSAKSFLPPIIYFDKKFSPSHKKMRTIFYAVGFAIFSFAFLVSFHGLRKNQETRRDVEVLSATTASQTTDAQGVAQGTGDKPAETPPTQEAIAKYAVEPERPRYIRIPKLSITTRVKELGLNAEGAVDAPANIYDVGWFNGTIQPGSKSGVSLLLGHVSGTTSPGVFKNLPSLVAGDEIEIETGSGKVFRYAVDKTEEYSTQTIDMTKILYEVPAGEQSLRLMTCSGTYNEASNSYNSRVVVFAKLK